MDHTQNVLLTQTAALLYLQLHTAQSGYFRGLVPKKNEIQSRCVGYGSVLCSLAVVLCLVCVTSLWFCALSVSPACVLAVVLCLVVWLWLCALSVSPACGLAVVLCLVVWLWLCALSV